MSLEEGGRRRWRIALLLGFGVLVNYFDRVNLSVSHHALQAEFGITDITYGYLLSAYSLTYALCQLPVGLLLDKLGVKKVGRVSAFVWSMASLSAALAPSVPAFFASRFLLGVGEAPTFPANAKAIGHWFPRPERSLATSLFDGAAKFASAIGVPLIGLLLLHVGWRWSFVTTGLFSFTYFLLFTFIYKEPEQDKKLTAQELAYIREAGTRGEESFIDGETMSFGQVFKQPKVLGLAIGFGAYNYVFYLLLTWLPSYLSQALGIDLLHSFLYTGVPWLFATVTDLFFGGWLVDWLIERGWDGSRVRMTALIAGLVFGLGIIGAAYTGSPRAALFWISISIGGLAGAAPVIWSVPSLIAPRGNVGTVGGIVNLAGQISGLCAPIITGYVVFHTHSFRLAFGISAVYLVLGIIAYLTMLRRIAPIRVA